jgi:hypothetical protein
MNIIKIQDMLRGVDDNALIGYVQNPQGQVPSYLALSELQRRKDTRAKYQQEQAPESSVAEDLAAPQGIAAIQQPPAAPVVQPGVAGLPVPDQMFSGQGMAAGGIVAFDDGGDVASSDAAPSDVAPGSDLPSDFYMSDIQRSLMGRSPVHYTGATAGPSPAPSSPYGTDMIGEMMRASPEALRYSYGVGRGTSPYAGAAYSSTRKEMGSPGYAEGGEVATSRVSDFFRGLGNPNAVNIDKQIGALQAEKNKIKSDIFKAYTPSERAVQQQRLADIDSQISMLTIQRSGKAPNTPASIPGSNVMGSEASAATPNQNPLSGLANPYAIPGRITPNINQPSPAAKPGLAADGTDPYALEKVRGIGDYAKELKDYIGADPMRAQLQERLSKMDAATAKQAEQAPWMALAQAGFSIAGGKSPFALQNIAEGAGAGLKEYAAAKDKMAALEDKRFALLNDMAQSDRKEQIAIGTYGANSKQAVEERNAKAKLQQAHDKVLMKMNTEDNAVKLAGATVKNALEAKDILKYKTDFRANHPDYLAWQKDMINRKGKSVVNTPDYKKASELLLDQLVARDATLSAPATGSAKFLGFE